VGGKDWGGTFFLAEGSSRDLKVCRLQREKDDNEHRRPVHSDMREKGRSWLRKISHMKGKGGGCARAGGEKFVGLRSVLGERGQPVARDLSVHNKQEGMVRIGEGTDKQTK